MFHKFYILLTFFTLNFNLFAMNPGSEERNYANILIQAIRDKGGASATGSENQKMFEVAMDFAKEMATNHASIVTQNRPSSARLGRNLISHIGAEDRYKSCPNSTRMRSEILATCTALTPKEGATQIADQWFKSPGHKKSMMHYHNYFAYALVRTDKLPGYSGYQWFAVGIFGDN